MIIIESFQLFEEVETTIDNLIKEKGIKAISKALGTSDSNKIRKALLVVFKRGYGAAKTNWASVRPHIKKIGKPGAYVAWGIARVNAFIAKGTTYKTTDSDVARWLKGEGKEPEGI